MKKILLIEDDKAVRENTSELLALANYQVITANNGKIGLALANTHRPDLIICDIMMPELNGYGVLQILYKDPKTQHIPFIFLSAKSEHKDIRKGMNLGADDYITKPFDESELFSAIESRLAKVAIMNENIQETTTNESTTVFVEEIKNLHNLKEYFYENVEEHSYHFNDMIYQEGDNSNYIFLIQSGIVKTYKIDEQGKELITGLHKEDDFFGFTSFTHNIPYQEFATAIEESVVLRLTKRELKHVLEVHPNLTIEFIDYLTGNVSEFKDQLLQMAYSSVRKKTANTILQFTKKMKKHPNENIKISRGDLASIAGIATETFIRTLSDFKKEGVIEIKGSNIEILDINKLKKMN